MLSRHNEVLKSHLEEVGKSQQEGTRMKAHYLSPSSQNEFINECGQLVMDAVLEEPFDAIYYTIITDGTPDSSHTD